MKTNIKNIRKSSITKIVIISDDKTILEKDLKNLYSDFEDIKIISSSEGINFKNMSHNDLLVLDMDMPSENFDNIASKANSVIALTPKIVIS